MTSSFSRISRRFVLAGLFALLIAACGSPQKADIYTKISDPKLKPGDSIPAPSGNSILSVSGKIGTTNSGDHIEMDLPTLESVGLVDYKVKDPFVTDKPTQVTFRGVLMSQLLDLWKVPADATTLEMTALNDYSVDVPISDLRKYPVIFALQQDGQYMPISTRGPAMLVYPYDNFEFDHTKYDAYWIWQIKSIKVK
jgi:hypothetical protein